MRKYLLAGLAMLVCQPLSHAAMDAAAIQQAINQATDRTILLPEGDYAIEQPVRLKSGVTLQGAGQDKTILRFRGAAGGAVFDLSGIQDAGLCEMTLDGGAAEVPHAGQAITASNAARLNIHHLTIQHFPKHGGFGPHGILFAGTNPAKEHGVTDSVIADCVLRDIGVDAEFGCGIRFSWGSSRNRVLRNTITDTGRGGIFADNGSKEIIIRGNTVSGSGGEGLAIEVWGGSDGSVIEDNRADHWISIGGSDDCAARRNTVAARDDYKFCGIEAIGNRLVVTDNTVDGGAKIGLSVSGPAPNNYVYWARNTVRGCNQWGAQFQAEAGGLACHYLYQCRFTGMPLGVGPVWYPGDEGHGFRLNHACRGMVFEECIFSGNGRLGLQVTGEGAEKLAFLRCAIKDNKGAAVSGLNPGATFSWEDCDVIGNGDNTLPEGKAFAAPAPVAGFDGPNSIVAGISATFTDRSKPAAAGGPAVSACLWDFGDGAPAFTTIKSGETASVGHTYAAPGDYRVTQIAWDAAGRGARAEKNVTVTQ